MTKSEQMFKAVNAEKAKHPDLSVAEICRRLNFKDPSLYYRLARLNKKAKPGPKPGSKPGTSRYQKIRAAKTDSATGDRLMCVVGSPEQLREFMAGAI